MAAKNYFEHMEAEQRLQNEIEFQTKLARVRRGVKEPKVITTFKQVLKVLAGLVDTVENDGTGEFPYLKIFQDGSSALIAPDGTRTNFRTPEELWDNIAAIIGD